MSEKLNHKPGLGDGEAVTRRHVETQLSIRRKKKDQRMEAKRKPMVTTFELDPISALPSCLNTPQDVCQLLAVLKMENSENYYNASETYPENKKGPWIFPNGDSKISNLIHIASTSKNLDVLKNATHCLICITAHKEVWTYSLLVEPFIPIGMQLLQHCPDYNLQENIFWIFNNMCHDNSHSRNLIISSGIIPALLSVDSDNPRLMLDACIVFRSLFKFHPLPNCNLIRPLWNKFIPQLYQDCSEQMCKELNGAVEYMVKSIDHAYKEAILQDMQFWNYITHHEDWFHIAVFMTNSCEIHDLLLSRGSLDFFISLLTHPNPCIRVEGAKALTNLALSSMCLPLLSGDQVLKTLHMQLFNSDVFRVITQIYTIITNMICTAQKNNQSEMLFPMLIEKKFIMHLCSAMQVPEPKLQENAVRAISYLVNFNRPLVMQQLEEYQGDQYLEHTLYMHPNVQIQKLVETILQ